MNVPDDPRGVLGLIKQVDEAIAESQVDQQQPLKDCVPVDIIDAQTGIATHTLVNSPVLLHCSAGVGRTGGFIAVHAILDAIRREIRQTHNGVPEEMQVDEPQDNIQGPTAPLTMSNGPDAGHFVVHVPLVETPMQVDEHKEPQIPMSHGPVSSGTQRWAENVHRQTGISGPVQIRDIQEPETQTLPDSTSSERDSSVESVVNSLQVSNTPNGSYHYPSSSSLGTSMSGTSSSSKATFPSSSASSLAPGQRPSNASALLSSVLNHQQRQLFALNQQQRVRTVSAPAANIQFNLRLPRRAIRETAQTMANTPEEIATSKLRTFQLRSPSKRASSDAEPPSSQSPSADEASTTFLTNQQEHQHMSAPPPVLFNSVQTEHAVSVSLPPPPAGQDSSPINHDTHVKAFDYKEPRPLHENKTPSALTTYEDPVLEVVQDMREQRMSLCQSLRQYVFVHAAIIEGALMVVDEEKDTAAGISSDVRQEPYSQSRGRELRRSSSVLSMVSTTSTGKRASSPTELRKEDVGGDVMLAKRPSMKRKDRSGDEIGRATEDQARYHPVPARMSSTVMHSGTVSAPSVRSMPP
jgi:hypothetical protein